LHPVSQCARLMARTRGLSTRERRFPKAGGAIGQNYAARRTDRRYSVSAAISTSLVVILLRSAHLATPEPHLDRNTGRRAFANQFQKRLGYVLGLGAENSSHSLELLCPWRGFFVERGNGARERVCAIWHTPLADLVSLLPPYGEACPRMSAILLWSVCGATYARPPLDARNRGLGLGEQDTRPNN